MVARHPVADFLQHGLDAWMKGDQRPQEIDLCGHALGHGLGMDDALGVAPCDAAGCARGRWRGVVSFLLAPVLADGALDLDRNGREEFSHGLDHGGFDNGLRLVGRGLRGQHDQFVVDCGDEAAALG